MICNIILPTECFPYAEDTEVCVFKVKTNTLVLKISGKLSEITIHIPSFKYYTV